MTTQRTDDDPAPATAEPGPDDDVVSLLMAQHGEIRNLFDLVERSEGDARRDAFRRLVRLLAVHETSEEEVVHPYTRATVDGGAQVVEERMAEEKEAKEALARLEDTDPTGPDFPPELMKLRTAVTEHARREERYEFALLRRLNEPAKLAGMARAVRAAEAMAPTRPHPGVQGMAENVLYGPVTAIVDRTRDAVRRAMGEDGD